MTRLLLRLHHPNIREQLPCSAVAKVRWLGELNGTPPKRWWTAEKPIGVGDTEFADFELPDGGYFGVDIVRARGTLISEEYRVAAGEQLEEIVHLPESPHESLSWAHFAGLVPSKSEAARELAAIRQMPEVSSGGASLTGVDLPEGESAWYQRLAGVPAGDQVTAYKQDDGRFVTWWLDTLSDQSRGSLANWIKEPVGSASNDKAVPPRWMAVSAGSTLDLVSIPWAWWLAPDDSPGEFQLIHDRYDPRQTRGRTVVSVRDSRWFPLLEFLASGRLGSAGQIANRLVNDALGALYLKVNGPLLAVAAGIILIARTKASESQFWDPWLDNLANWFPRIPDGKILLGCRRLQQARNEDERRAAFFHLEEGFRRGIPYMSASFRMLSTALAQLGSDQPEDLRRVVAAMAAQVDPDQPFTVIRI
jgi:hypothetical protein